MNRDCALFTRENQRTGDRITVSRTGQEIIEVQKPIIGCVMKTASGRQRIQQSRISLATNKMKNRMVPLLVGSISRQASNEWIARRTGCAERLLARQEKRNQQKSIWRYTSTRQTKLGRAHRTGLARPDSGAQLAVKKCQARKSRRWARWSGNKDSLEWIAENETTVPDGNPGRGGSALTQLRPRLKISAAKWRPVHDENEFKNRTLRKFWRKRKRDLDRALETKTCGEKIKPAHRWRQERRILPEQKHETSDLEKTKGNMDSKYKIKTDFFITIKQDL
jgi:hypothetical protein